MILQKFKIDTILNLVLIILRPFSQIIIIVNKFLLITYWNFQITIANISPKLIIIDLELMVLKSDTVIVVY